MNGEERVKQHIKNKTGFSFLVSGGVPKSGYVVSVTNYKVSDISDSEITQIIRTAYQLQKMNAPYKIVIGGWYDKETKQYFLDISFLVNSKYSALLLGALLHQATIWDIEQREEIEVTEENIEKAKQEEIEEMQGVL